MTIKWTNISSSEVGNAYDSILKTMLEGEKAQNKSFEKATDLITGYQDRQVSNQAARKGYATDQFMDTLTGRYKDSASLQSAIDSGEVDSLLGQFGPTDSKQTRTAATDLLAKLTGRERAETQHQRSEVEFNDRGDRLSVLDLARQGKYDPTKVDTYGLDGDYSQTLAQAATIQAQWEANQRAAAERAAEQQALGLVGKFDPTASRGQASDLVSQLRQRYAGPDGTFDPTALTDEQREEYQSTLLQAGNLLQTPEQRYEAAMQKARQIPNLKAQNQAIEGLTQRYEFMTDQTTRQKAANDANFQDWLKKKDYQNNTWLNQEGFVAGDAAAEAVQEIQADKGWIAKIFGKDATEDGQKIYEALTKGRNVEIGDDGKKTLIQLTPAHIKLALSNRGQAGWLWDGTASVDDALDAIARSVGGSEEYAQWQEIKDHRDKLDNSGPKRGSKILEDALLDFSGNPPAAGNVDSAGQAPAADDKGPANTNSQPPRPDLTAALQGKNVTEQAKIIRDSMPPLEQQLLNPGRSGGQGQMGRQREPEYGIPQEQRINRGLDVIDQIQLPKGPEANIDYGQNPSVMAGGGINLGVRMPWLLPENMRNSPEMQQQIAAYEDWQTRLNGAKRGFRNRSQARSNRN